MSGGKGGVGGRLGGDGERLGKDWVELPPPIPMDALVYPIALDAASWNTITDPDRSSTHIHFH